MKGALVLFFLNANIHMLYNTFGYNYGLQY
jgi:hypothetical protein